jgi:hypothetical protein
MTPLEQTGFTLFCMFVAYIVGKKSGIKMGINYIFKFMTDYEIEKIGNKIEKDESR